MTDPTEKKENQINNKGLIRRCLANPAFNGIGLIVGLIAVCLSILFFIKSRGSIEIIYYTNLWKTIIFNSKESPELDIYYQNNKVNKDITANQVSIWNNGRTPAEKSDMLSPIEIFTDPQVRIIKATIRYQTRSEVGLQLDDTKYAIGVVPISWKILEKNDGGEIQITYFGDTNVDIKLRGSLKGQKQIERSKSLGKYFIIDKGTTIRFLYTAAIFSLCAGIYTIIGFFKLFSHNKKLKKWKVLLVIIVIILCIFYFKYIADILKIVLVKSPPFFQS